MFSIRFVSFLWYCLRAGHFKTKILQAFLDVRADQERLVDIFESIELFLQRLEIYTEVPLIREMINILTTIMVEVICILAIVAREIKRSRSSKSLLWSYIAVNGLFAEKVTMKLLGRTDIADALMRLNKLMQDEIRMATVHTYTVGNRGRAGRVTDRVHGIDNGVPVASVHNTVASVDVDDKARRTEIEDALEKIDKPMQEEVRIATAQSLKVTHTVNHKARRVADKVHNFNNVKYRVASVDDAVARVGDGLKAIDDKDSIIDRNTSYEDILRPSAKALGKRRLVETEEVDCKSCTPATQQILSLTPPQSSHSI